MNAAIYFARTVTLGFGLRPLALVACAAPGLLALAACDAQPSGDATSKKADAKPADAKPADAKPPAGTKQPAEVTNAGRNKAHPTEAHPTEAHPTKADPTEPETTVLQAGGAGQGDPTARKYRRGMTPPEGMSEADIEKFAAEVGDPSGGKFTLEQAFEGDPTLADPTKGKLMVTFDTTMGTFDCELFEEKAPLTVANFVGLARGKRPTYDKKTDSWVTKNYYDGVIFHRVIKNFMVQTGDDTNTGRGNSGYVILDEFVKSLRHDGPGVLSMANRSQPNTGSTQFFITVRDTKHLDGKHAVFGKCADAKIPIAMSQVKVDHRAGDRPYEQIKINTVTISRK